MLRYLIVFSIIVFCGCQNATEDKSKNWITVVEHLKTLDDKQLFLEDIYKSVASSRTASDNAIKMFGYKSDEHLKRKETYIIIRDEAFQKIDAYLNTHGYPSVMKLGGIAAYAPFFVIQNMDDIKSREKNFTYLYDGYMFGDVTSDAFYKYLSELYYLDYKKDFLYDPNIDTKSQINALLKALQYQ